MTRTTNFKGAPLTLLGTEVKVGQTLPEFKVTGVDMADITSAQFSGAKLVILSVPSLDTPVCSVEARRFSEEAAKLGSNVKILTVSRDLPFAQKRWCGAEGVENLVMGSDYKYRSFAEQFGVLINDWQLLSRAVIVVNEKGTVTHVEYVPEISQEPDYAAALESLK
jgi:thiol peroxidase